MKSLLLRGFILWSALFILGVYKPTFVHAQCFHLGQAFDCKGLPDGTSSVSFNENGTINLSNGQIVPGNFFDTPFRVPNLDATPTLVTPTPDRPPITFFPTTADGINALTAFSHAFEGTDVGVESIKYNGLSYFLSTSSFGRHDLKVGMESFPDKKPGEADWKYIEGMYRRGYIKGCASYDPKVAQQLLEEAGWTETRSGENKPLRYGAGYKGAEVADVGWPGEHKEEYKQEFLGGPEFEVARSVSLGVRYIHRSIPRVLEDVPPYYVGPEGVGKGVLLGNIEGVKISLENGIDQMDSEAVPVPELPQSEVFPPQTPEHLSHKDEVM